MEINNIKNIIYNIVFILYLLTLISSAPTDLNLDTAVKGSLPDKTYAYYKLKMPVFKEKWRKKGTKNLTYRN